MTTAASALKAVLLCSGLSRQDTSRLVPSHLLSPGHHTPEEVHQLILLGEVLADPVVVVALADGEVLLVLPHLHLASLAPPLRGRVYAFICMISTFVFISRS